mmetsp:Transcript_50005/g.100663  ORF Transcript_50005/g.100663 Transcript_50005/m.100663 type:complete len:324 (-) Transcript_50005:2789-3760(-)
MHVPQKEISLDDIGTASSLKSGIPSSGPLGTLLDDEVDNQVPQKGTSLDNFGTRSSILSRRLRGTQLDDEVDLDDVEKGAVAFTDCEKKKIMVVHSTGRDPTSGLSSAWSMSVVPEEGNETLARPASKKISWANIAFMALLGTIVTIIHTMIKLQKPYLSSQKACVVEEDILNTHILAFATFKVCTCVPLGLLSAYYNPATMAVSAMLIPNLIILALLLIKFTAPLRDWLLRKFIINENDETSFRDGVMENSVANACKGVDVLAFILNIAFGLNAAYYYFVSDVLVPYGDGLCMATHATFSVMYKPISISIFGALVAASDMAY